MTSDACARGCICASLLVAEDWPSNGFPAFEYDGSLVEMQKSRPTIRRSPVGSVSISWCPCYGLPLAHQHDADDEHPDLQGEVGNDGDGQDGNGSDG
jgi:hypothetical protein